MKKNNTLLIILATVMLAFIGIFAFSYTKSIQKKTQESIATRLEEITASNKDSFDRQMQEQKKMVETTARYLGECQELETIDNLKLLKAQAEGNGLLRCAVIFPDGNFITNDAQNDGNVLNTNFFKRALEGEFVISPPQPSVVNPAQMVITLASPIEKNDEVIGALAYAYPCDELDSLFQLSFMEGEGKIIVASENGSVLLGGVDGVESGDNLLKHLQQKCSHEGHTPDKCGKLSGKQGISYFSDRETENRILVSYSKLNINDWYIFSLVPEEAAGDSLHYVAQQQRNMGALVGSCILIYLIIGVVLWARTREDVDKLTGEKTLESFKRAAKKILKKHKKQTFVIVKLDVRNFKLINRIYDFGEGDRLIKSIARALRMVLENRPAVFARVGIDDFILLLPYIDKDTLVRDRNAFVEEFRSLMGSDFSTNIDFPTGQYIISQEEAAKADMTEMFEKVNFAHRAAKRCNGSVIIDYEETIEKEAIFQQEIEDKMVPALENEEFALYLQPKYAMPGEQLCGAEALVRWSIKDMIYVYPTDFVPVFERNGFIVKIDMYMFKNTVRFLRKVIDMGIKPPVVSVNFSRYHLDNARFVQQLCHIADEYEVPHEYLEIELTETVICESVDLITNVIQQIHEKGFKISMDDFGSGYSSLGLLKDLDVDVIKIDQRFFAHSFETYRAKTVVQNLIHMAKQLKIKTVAEGVETREIVDTLKEMGCDIIQGYYFARPMPEEEMLKLLGSEK